MTASAHFPHVPIASWASDAWDWLEPLLSATYEHLYLSLVSLVLAICIAVPIGIYLTRTRFRRLRSGILGAAGVIQTIPTLALIALVMVVFVLIPEDYRPPTTGPFPAIVALTLYALLPILRNTYTGINQVDPSVIEVARGMGMRPTQVLLRVELPLALPVIMAGIRISAVWTIGIAALATLIGAGGLGEIIIRGLRTVKPLTLIKGTVPAAALALVFDWLLEKLEQWLTPAGLRD
jgi:osmoprotectant transport system permease protein